MTERYYRIDTCPSARWTSMKVKSITIYRRFDLIKMYSFEQAFYSCFLLKQAPTELNWLSKITKITITTTGFCDVPKRLWRSYLCVCLSDVLLSLIVTERDHRHQVPFSPNSTYSSNSTPSLPGCNFNPRCMNFGPHQAKAPVTKATQVNPRVDNINDGFLAISRRREIEVRIYWFLGGGIIEKVTAMNIEYTNQLNPLCMMSFLNDEILRFVLVLVLWLGR